MNFTKNVKTLIIELIKDKFEMNKQNIEYCKQYIEDGFLMEETKELREKNIESNKELINKTMLDQRTLFKLFNRFQGA